jgi:hypothetical protein
MNRGYVRLWRKSLDAGWIKNHKLWAFWTYCLMKASYKEFDAIVGLQIIHLLPGQFIFGRKKASQETGLTEREIRTIVEFLRKAGNLTIITTNRFSIITIINWPTYQGDNLDNDQLNDQLPTSKRPHTNIKALKNKETPCEVLCEISELAKRYSDQETIDQAFQAISSTRKLNRIADTVKCSILKTWERHPAESVIAGIRTYLEKGYHGQGKDEKYLLGIIRNLKPEASMTAGQVMKSTGSPLYDAYLRGEIKVSQEATTP